LQSATQIDAAHGVHHRIPPQLNAPITSALPQSSSTPPSNSDATQQLQSNVTDVADVEGDLHNQGESGASKLVVANQSASPVKKKARLSQRKGVAGSLAKRQRSNGQKKK
jgi:hypothetical protein